ncbi:shikimate dehydrogenase [Moorella thermoacetica]|uniref:Shikimate dehydrogenase (NADP(+)) n=1 Tax=Neomoorella thermoacetica TaxID=1525 RepID=A0A1J5JEZ5_NEOTH|nr:shikimate dehydrogenase [Moorella thermoacetica]OIQ07757.1 shikimate dehydrogenase [Moorella thermoacetica]
MIQVKASTGLVALLGHPVQHSLSPLMHNAAFAAGGQNLVYLAFDVEPGDLVAALAGLKALGFRGANVTVPHKEAVIPYLDAVDPVAARIGAVNTIVNEDRCLKGYNTDGSGFLRSLEEAGFDPAGKRAVILGAGGAARAVAFALAAAGCGSLVLANRTPERATELAGALAGAGLPAPVVYRLGDAGMRSEVEAADLVLNTTSLGMWPRVEETPLPPDWFRPGQWVYDLVYNPLETKFLASARRRGCRVISGLDMLLYQGAAAFTLWTGREAPVAVMARVLREAMGASSGGPAAGR